ncbi:alpha-L-rhamnosidase C-terminal domain-containing protein [Flavihumibacter sp. UBA7668]|uniref:alpha-L-rhamnosidase-related protein n=1 Tax=Flavihumibacter sp. UBA7668 TaxID=1946542 RepID=UPI0025C0CD76|nr:alpha-L-rhamnosidase C-terminal domain-containing protein [Flavihumibacter sp. UBA7668]
MIVLFSFRVLLIAMAVVLSSGCLIAQLKLGSLPGANTIPLQITEVDRSPNVRAYTFNPSGLVPEINWTADWIWLNPSQYPQLQRTKTTWLGPQENNYPYRVFFRRELEYKSGNEPVYLYCTADVRFRLYINGKLTAEGPVNTGGDYNDSNPPGYWYYSVYDISTFLTKGKNTIAVEVFSWALEWSEITSTYGRFIAEIKSGKQTLLRSDTNWKAATDTSLQRKADWLEWQVAKEIPEWKSVEFDDAAWPKAAIQINASATRLIRSSIPELMQTPLQPKNLLRNSKVSEDHYLLDFSKNRVARIQCSFTAKAGDTIEIIPFEKKEYVASPSRAIRLIAKEGKTEFRSPNLAAFRYLKVRIAASAPVQIHSFEAIFTTYPVAYQGSFSCSDNFYNQLWSIARYTTQLCMGDMFYDSPMHQEPNACTGDYFIESLNAFYAFGESWLTRQNLVQTAQMLEKNSYRMFHTSYSLIWVQMLQKYVHFTGDSTILSEVLPAAHQLMTLFRSYLNKDYLIANAPNYMFMDWIKIDRFNAHHPPAMIGTGYMTAFYFKALKDLVWLQEWGSRHSVKEASIQTAQQYNRLADSIKWGIESMLWDSGRKLYRDGIAGMTTSQPSFWLPADTAIITYSAHMNTLAVLYGIAPKERELSLIDYVVTQNEYELQPYFMSYVLASLTKLGKTDEGLEQVDKWKFGIDTSTYTLKENWQEISATGYRGDYSHAWGGAPLLFLSTNLLGVTPYSSGYRQITIHPYEGNKINWANGKVPIGNNEVVEVDWSKEKVKSRWKYNLPSNRTGILRMPESWRNKQIYINGKKVNYQKEMTCSSSTIFIEVQ